MKLVSNEQELVEQAKQGNLMAFEKLFESYQTPVYNFILRMLGRQQDSEDVLQEVFVKIYQKLGTLREPKYFSSWLFRIAKNESINFATRYRAKDTDSIDELEPALAERFVTDESQSGSNPVEKTEQSELEDLLQAALNELPVNIRASFILGVIEGHSYKEVSKMLGCSIGNVKSRVFRARSLLSQKLQPHFQR
ncbi:sigma-70 family RNA polymerase sigma factor [bacterium]|nr:sigma-70 family RNA polymerase sigma factor [bacterium]